MTRSFRAFALLLLVAGCDQGPSDATSRRPRPQADASDASSVRVTIRDGNIILPREDVPAGPTVIVVVNDGAQDHTLRLEQKGQTIAALASPISRGASGIIRAELRPGSYDVCCPLLRHRDKERTTLRVE